MEKTKFKYVPFGVKFIHNGQEYTKTSHNRGYYYSEGRKVFRNFKKQTLVLLDKQYLELPF